MQFFVNYDLLNRNLQRFRWAFCQQEAKQILFPIMLIALHKFILVKHD